MNWLPDSNDPEVLEHEGYAATVLDDGTVTGWCAACTCGWRDPYQHPTTAWREQRQDSVPKKVSGACRSAWKTHLHGLFPQVAVDEAAAHFDAEAARENHDEPDT